MLVKRAIQVGLTIVLIIIISLFILALCRTKKD